MEYDKGEVQEMVKCRKGDVQGKSAKKGEVQKKVKCKKGEVQEG